jgi:RimJ/RimL family protein N-acetyltransferase
MSEARLETERLLLRPAGIGDVDEYVALSEDPEVTRFVTALDRRGAAERLAANEREWRERGHGMFALIDRRDGRFLGRAGLKYWPQFDETEVGWVLRRDVWGQGYASEAAGAILDWGFGVVPAPYFTAMIDPDNERSIRVARRLGLSPLRRDALLGTPVVVYAVTRDAWAGDERG